MILIINLCKEKLHYLEFVKPARIPRGNRHSFGELTGRGLREEYIVARFFRACSFQDGGLNS